METAFGDLMNQNGFALTQRKVKELDDRRVSKYYRILTKPLIDNSLAEYTNVD
jgi:hypothetical protein